MRFADVCLNLEFSEHSVHDDVKVKLAHTCDDGLSRFLVGVSLKGGIFLLEFDDCHVHSFLAGFRLWLDCHLDDRIREDHVFKNDLVVFVRERVARGALFEADDRHDVACVRFFDVLAVVRVHTKDTTDSFVFALDGVVNHGACRQSSRIDADEGEFSDKLIRENLEYKCAERFFFARVTKFGLSVFGIDTLDAGNVRRGRQEIDDRIKHKLYACVLVRTSAENGIEFHLYRTLADCGFEFVHRDGIVILHDDLLKDIFIEVCRGFEHFESVLVCKIFVLCRDFLGVESYALILLVIVESLHRKKVDNAFEFRLFADWQRDWDCVCVQSFTHHFDCVVEVRTVYVHFVDESDSGHFVRICLTPYVFGLRFDAAFGAEHRNRSVEDSQTAFDFNGEVYVSGSIDDVYLMSFPHSRGCRRSDGDTSLSFLFHVVHGCGTVVSFTEFSVHARVV